MNYIYSVTFLLVATLTGEYRNFRICLCLEIGSKAQEAIPFCQRAISICKSRVQRLSNEIKSLSESPAISTTSEFDQPAQQSSNISQADNPISDKEAEIETLNGLSSELEKKASLFNFLQLARKFIYDCGLIMDIWICSLKICSS